MDIADPLRRQLKADKQSDGAVILRWPRGFLILSPGEVDRLYAFTNDKPRLQCFPAKSRPKSPLTNDPTIR
jgi:hypothetical protein